jgi:hypothetical protein
VKRQQHILPTHDHAPPKHVSSYYTESIYSNNITFYNASIFITLVLFQTSKMDINRTVLLVDDDGRLAFVRLKSDAEINDIPIIIFSTSKNLLDQLFFEKQNAPYFVKPDNFQQFIDISIMMISHCVHNRK